MVVTRFVARCIVCRTMPRDYKTLGDLQGRLTHLDVRCRRCERRGRLCLARLLAEHGPGMGLPHLRQALAGDCPRREASEFERCNVYFRQLVGLFLGEERGSRPRGGRE